MIQLSDPKPAYCSACHNSDPAGRYVDFEAAHDGGAFVDRATQAYVDGSDDLHVCERCVKVAAEVIAYRANLDRRQAAEIRRLTAAAQHWETYAKSLEQTLQERPERAPMGVKRAVPA